PSLLTGLTLPTSALLVRALMDWNILEYRGAWITISIATVLLSGLLLMGTKEFSYTKFQHLFAGLLLTAIMLCYVYGGYVIANCLFDQSAPEEFVVQVVDKEIGSGRVTTYDVVVGPFSRETKPRKLGVTKRQFDKLTKGDSVALHIREGFFGTPWLYV